MLDLVTEDRDHEPRSCRFQREHVAGDSKDAHRGWKTELVKGAGIALRASSQDIGFITRHLYTEMAQSCG